MSRGEKKKRTEKWNAQPRTGKKRNTQKKEVHSVASGKICSVMLRVEKYAVPCYMCKLLYIGLQNAVTCYLQKRHFHTTSKKLKTESNISYVHFQDRVQCMLKCSSAQSMLSSSKKNSNSSPESIRNNSSKTSDILRLFREQGRYDMLINYKLK